MTNPLTGMLVRPFMQRRNAKKLIIKSAKGIHEESYVTLGGIDQWVTIRGQDKENPVLLLVHGGPGSSYMAFSSWLTEWEKHFTIAQWDQRGGGKTFQKNGAQGSGKLSFEQLAADGLELTEYLREHLGKQKIVLVGSSLGSLVSLHMIHKRPELFYAYVGTEQNAPGNLSVSYQLTLKATQKVGNKKGLALLNVMGNEPAHWTQQQYEAMNKLSIAVSKDVPNMVYDIMLPGLLFSPDYTMNDIKDLQKGMEYSMGQLFNQLVNFDYKQFGNSFMVPFFVFQGAGDILTPVTPVREYVEAIKAPRKEFVLIERAGHLAAFCNPEQFLQELLNHVKPLTK